MSIPAHMVMHTTREGTDVMVEHPHLCPRCQQLTRWFQNRDGRSRCIRCTHGESPEHDPHACDIEACETCRGFWRDERETRQYDDWREAR